MGENFLRQKPKFHATGQSQLKCIPSYILTLNCFKIGLRQYQIQRIRSDQQMFDTTPVQKISKVKDENMSTMEVSEPFQLSQKRKPKVSHFQLPVIIDPFHCGPGLGFTQNI